MLLRSALLALCLPLPALAHPHIFINTGFEVIVNDAGQVSHIRVSWTYDELYSLLVTEDMGLDQDYDGVLTEAETERLSGFDMAWDEGFYGDTVALAEGKELTLSRPVEYSASFEDGKITTTHLREVAELPVLTETALKLLPYDETFYTAYEARGPVEVAGAEGCLISRIEPDIDAELEKMRDALALLDQSQDPEAEGIGNIGRNFATEVLVQCAGS